MSLSDHLIISPESDVPLVAQLVDQLTWLMAVGLLAPGDGLPPIRELAQSTGVHMHTVREAYHRLERDGLVDIRRRRGTVVLPFDPIQQLKNKPQGRSFLFGVLLPVQASVYRGFLQGVHRAAARYGWMPLIAYTGDRVQMADRYFHQLLAKDVDGFIIASTPIVAGSLELKAFSELVPVIHVDAPHEPANSIMVDSERAAFLATEHLMEHGHRRVALITPPLSWQPVEPCFEGYQSALRSGGLEFDPNLIFQVPDFSHDSGRRGIHELLALEDPPSAAFFVSDSLALGGLAALSQKGITVPAEFALTSFNDLEEAALVSPGITTASFPSFEMGELAVDQLIKLHRGEHTKGGRIVLGTELIVRQSCGCNQGH